MPPSGGRRPRPPLHARLSPPSPLRRATPHRAGSWHPPALPARSLGAQTPASRQLRAPGRQTEPAVTAREGPCARHATPRHAASGSLETCRRGRTEGGEPRNSCVSPRPRGPETRPEELREAPPGKADATSEGKDSGTCVQRGWPPAGSRSAVRTCCSRVPTHCHPARPRAAGTGGARGQTAAAPHGPSADRRPWGHGARVPSHRGHRLRAFRGGSSEPPASCLPR